MFRTVNKSLKACKYKKYNYSTSQTPKNEEKEFVCCRNLPNDLEVSLDSIKEAFHKMSKKKKKNQI